MPKLFYAIIGLIAGAIVFSSSIAYAIGTSFPITSGGTGTSTAPSGQVIYGGGGSGINQAYQSTATTSVTCSGSASCTSFTVLGSSPITITASGGGGSGTVSTSTNETKGFLPYWTSTSGTPATLGQVATTSVTCSGNTTCSSFTVIGASPITISSTGGGTGLSTTSPISAGNLLEYSGAGAGAAFGIATTSIACSGFITCTGFNALGSASTITTTGQLAIANGGTATSTYYTGGVNFFDGTEISQAANSAFARLFWDNTNFRLGIGTSTPARALDIANAGTVSQVLLEDTGAAANNHLWSIGTSRGSFHINSMTDAQATTTRVQVNATGTGLGTSTPVGALTVQTATNEANDFVLANSTGATVVGADTLNTAGNFFNIASSTGTSLFAISGDGLIVTGGTAPTLNTCGTSPNITATSTDNRGTIHTGTGSPTTCNITFAHAHADTPTCVVSDNSTTINADVAAASTTGVQFAVSAALNSGTLYYWCIQ